METLTTFANRFMTGLSLITAFGVFMHDGRVDRAAMVATMSPHEIIPSNGETIATRMKTFTETDAHTHPDHNTGKNLMNSFTYQSPSVPPRREQNHKLVLSDIEEGGRHAFDNTNLPVLT